MRSALVLAALIAVTSEVLARDLHVGENGPGAVVMRISGANTANAVVLGETTYRLARLHCERDPTGITRKRGGDLTLNQCVAQTMRNRKPLRIAANCPERRITTADTGSLVLIDVVDGKGVWTRTDQSLDSMKNPPRGGQEIDDQFKLLCPRFFTAPTNVARNRADPLPAESPSHAALHGEWDMFPSYCQRQDDGESRLRITNTAVVFYGESCSIQEANRTGDDRWQVISTCNAEDDEMPTTYFLNVVGNRLMLLDGSEIGPKRIYHRCN